MYRQLITLTLAGGLFAVAQADTIQLTSGQKTEGRVEGLVNGRFEVVTAQGEVQRVAVGTLKRIEFAGAGAIIQTANRGTVKGTAKSYENGTLTLTLEDGKAATVPVAFIKEATFSGGGGGGKDIETISRGGTVDVAKNLVTGKVTIVDFYADWCGPCRAIGPYLEELAKTDADVVLRKVDIKEWGSPVARQYKINAIPHIEIYDGKGKLIDTIVGPNRAGVDEAVARAKKQKS